MYPAWTIIDTETGLGILGSVTVKQNEVKTFDLKVLDYMKDEGNVYLIFNPQNKKQEIKNSFIEALLN